MSKLRVLALLCAAACGGAPGPATEPSPPRSEASRWDALVQAHIEATFRADPGFAVAQGRHDFDGRIADLSRAGIAHTVARLHATRSEVLAFPSDRLDEARRFERDYLLASIDGQLFWSERYRDWERNPRLYADAIDPSTYLTRDYAPLTERMAAYVAHAREIPRVIGAMKENLRSQLAWPFVEVASAVFAGLGPYLGYDVPALFASVDDDELQAELAEVTQAAVLAVADAVRFLNQQRKRAHGRYALGPELMHEMLWATERVDTELFELEQIGRDDLERNLAALTSACDELAKGATLRQCAQRVNDDKPRGGPVQAAREQLDVLQRFVREHDLVTIPGGEQTRVAAAPPYQRWNLAYIEMSGPFERATQSTYFIAPPDPSWSEADRLAYMPGAADLLFISVHEVWPGHLLQTLHANRAARPLGRVFVGYAFAEGWAHYAEEMMWEAGLGRGDAKVHVGQLLNALLRDARFLSAIGLHSGTMTIAESEKLFREAALQDASNARQQAMRGTFDPAYLNYTLGKLMIRKLREDYIGTRGGRAAWHEFHDRLLSFGGPPLPLVRRALVGDTSALF